MRWSGRGNSLMSRKAACRMWIPCQQQAYLTVGQVSRWRPFHSRESPTPTLMAPPNAISLPLLPQRCPLATQETQSLSALLEVWALLLAWSQRRSYKFCLPIPQCCAICPFHSCFPCWQTQLQSQRQHLQQRQLCEMHQAALHPQFWVALSSLTQLCHAGCICSSQWGLCRMTHQPCYCSVLCCLYQHLQLFSMPT